MGKATRYWQETPAMTCQWKLGSSSGLRLRSHPDQDDGQRMPVHVPQCIRSIVNRQGPSKTRQGSGKRKKEVVHLVYVYVGSAQKKKSVRELVDGPGHKAGSRQLGLGRSCGAFLK